MLLQAAGCTLSGTTLYANIPLDAEVLTFKAQASGITVFYLTQGGVLPKQKEWLAVKAPSKLPSDIDKSKFLALVKDGGETAIFNL